MLITEQKALDEFCASMKGKDYITVDTEFLREKTYYPKLCLIQIGDRDKKAAAIDPLVEGLNLRPVLDLLFDQNILKIFHAARQDLEIFYNLTGKVVDPIFDTQIAAMVCGYGDSVGYDNLVRNITGSGIDKSSQFTNWAHRPLSDKQIHYALGDVTHLVDVYEHLKEKLDARGRTDWVFQEEEILSDPATYENDPYEAWRRVKIKTPKPKNLAVLREVAAWREKRAQDKNLPKSWVLRDDTLADLAGQTPRDVKALKKIRNMPGEVAGGRHGQALLKLINGVLDTDPKNWPQPKKRKSMPPHVAATIDVLRLLLKIKAAENGVATKLLCSTEDIESLAIEDKPDIPAMKGWRYDMFGKDAIEIKTGKLSIGLNGNKIVRYVIDNDSTILE